MKKIAGLVAILLCCSLWAVAQHSKEPKKTRDSLPYQKYPTLPAFNLLELDSSTIFNTYNIPEGKPVVLMFYSPDCDHCQKLAQEIMKHMDSLSVADFYLLTPMTIGASKVFYDQYHVKNYKNIRLFKDYEFFFPRFYGASYVPYLAIYDRHKKLVKVYEGGAKTSELIRVLNGL
ncbi:TlpA family protein disulfide reductase [Chitinophagaceae bacterium MMS25-I14]